MSVNGIIQVIELKLRNWVKHPPNRNWGKLDIQVGAVARFMVDIGSIEFTDAQPGMLSSSADPNTVLRYAEYGAREIEHHADSPMLLLRVFVDRVLSDHKAKLPGFYERRVDIRVATSKENPTVDVLQVTVQRVVYKNEHLETVDILQEQTDLRQM